MNSKTSLEGITSNTRNSRNQTSGWQNLTLVCSLWFLAFVTWNSRTYVAPQAKNQINSITSALTANSEATNSNPGLQFCSDCMFANE